MTKQPAITGGVQTLQTRLGLAIDWANRCAQHARHTTDAEIRAACERSQRIALDEARLITRQLRAIHGHHQEDK